MKAPARLLQLTLVLPLLLTACTRRPASPNTQTPDAAQAAPPSAACTLATPLVPGVPGSPGHLMPSARNPNGQSELAALMRTLQADLLTARAAITQRAPLTPLLARHQKIRCSWPTKPEDRDAQFDANASAYLAAVAALESAVPASQAAAFDGVLNACRSCHEQTCSGAIVAIEALRLPGMARPAP